MNEMGAPDKSRSALRLSKARQALTTKTGIQQRKKRTTMTSSMRMTRFLAIRLAVGLLLQTRLSLVLGLLEVTVRA